MKLQAFLEKNYILNIIKFFFSLKITRICNYVMTVKKKNTIKIITFLPFFPLFKQKYPSPFLATPLWLERHLASGRNVNVACCWPLRAQ